MCILGRQMSLHICEHLARMHLPLPPALVSNVSRLIWPWLFFFFKSDSCLFCSGRRKLRMLMRLYSVLMIEENHKGKEGFDISRSTLGAMTMSGLLFLPLESSSRATEVKLHLLNYILHRLISTNPDH